MRWQSRPNRSSTPSTTSVTLRTRTARSRMRQQAAIVCQRAMVVLRAMLLVESLVNLENEAEAHMSARRAIYRPRMKAALSAGVIVFEELHQEVTPRDWH